MGGGGVEGRGYAGVKCRLERDESELLGYSWEGAGQH